MALLASAGPTARNHDPQSPGAPCPAAAHPQWEAGQAGVAGSGLCEGSHAAGGTADSAGKPIVCVVGGGNVVSAWVQIVSYEFQLCMGRGHNGRLGQTCKIGPETTQGKGCSIKC